MEGSPQSIQPVDTSGTNKKSLTNIKITNDCAYNTSNIILYVFQMIIILSVVWTSIYNLTHKTGDPTLWTTLLSSSIGYVLPSPSITPIKPEDEK